MRPVYGQPVRIGLTGGIGSGKSTVSAALAERGAAVIDADAVVRELQAPGQPVLGAMVEHFGPAILHPDGTLDRQAVADRVFTDTEALGALNAIVHPAVGAEIVQRLATAEATGALVVLDVPLLVENDAVSVDVIVVVDTDADLAVHRLVTLRGFDEVDARARMARQASRDERRARADFVVVNDGDRAALDGEIDRLWRWIESRSEAAAGR